MSDDIEPANSSTPEVPGDLPNLPFPEPDKLKEYEDVLPGFGHRWMTAWERAIDSSFLIRAKEIEESQKTYRRAWYSREIRLTLFGVTAITYLFVGLVTGLDSRATYLFFFVALGAALESVWRWASRRIRARRETTNGDD